MEVYPILKIGKTHGLNGELKFVYLPGYEKIFLNNSTENFQFYLQRNKSNVWQKSKGISLKNNTYLKIDGVHHIDVARYFTFSLIGLVNFPFSDYLFPHQIIGLKVINENKIQLGQVINVFYMKKQILLDIEGEKNNYYIPMTEKHIISVDSTMIIVKWNEEDTSK
jgi:ribosomal 30S subunit maturation factor RimM